MGAERETTMSDLTTTIEINGTETEVKVYFDADDDYGVTVEAITPTVGDQDNCVLYKLSLAEVQELIDGPIEAHYGWLAENQWA